jgi:hypothetical protein
LWLRLQEIGTPPASTSPPHAEKIENALNAYMRLQDKENCNTFLHSSIPSNSRKISRLDMEILLVALRNGWGRSSPSEVEFSAGADAMRVKIYILL